MQYLRNAHGEILGWLDNRRGEDDPTQHLMDAHGNYLGMYLAEANTTFDQHGNIVGKGNILMTLLKCRN